MVYLQWWEDWFDVDSTSVSSIQHLEFNILLDICMIWEIIILRPWVTALDIFKDYTPKSEYDVKASEQRYH